VDVVYLTGVAVAANEAGAVKLFDQQALVLFELGAFGAFGMVRETD
jgi:hypothetical protein